MQAHCAHRRVNTAGAGFIHFFAKKSAQTEIREGIPDLYPRLWRYAFALSGRRDVADDLAQMTCVRALEKHELFTAGTALDRWMFRTMHRIWLNEIRSATVRRAGGLVPVETLELPAENTDVETNIFAAQVLSVIGGLPEAMRATVVLVYVEGYSYREAAEHLEVPIGTIMSRLAAARKKLKGLTSQEERHAGE